MPVVCRPAFTFGNPLKVWFGVSWIVVIVLASAALWFASRSKTKIFPNWVAT
jgi:hypothetical protein